MNTLATDGKPVRILAIESSCDETAAAVVEDGRRTLSGVVYSQIALHLPYGGVVPEIASRSHIEKIDAVVGAAMEQSGIVMNDLDAVAVTQGPGLVGALLVGVSYAKGLAFALGKPLIAVNHIMGHIASNLLAHKDLKPPFLCLVASGGHSHLVEVREEGLRLIGRTTDDAAGEAFDKAARVLGLPYPGGPNLDRLAATGNPYAYALPVPRTEMEYDYSFSGLKTAFINLVHKLDQGHEPYNPADLAAVFRETVVSHLCDKAIRACRERGWDRLALAGGVAANVRLRERLGELCEADGIRLYLPPLSLTGDNAEMIGAAAYLLYRNGAFAGLDLNADPGLTLPLSP
ncbi:MAG TPA: tRNA (adenosine(37)-N6)-threonylcarbamoyltransferase complex transferase subunit TsaD [Candidatus Limnocylindria bacterium]|nr:tRNA (adenosine(37)-N6)-threonylcarbamoyltransferase complex transferase subunit TsaD [Candidatus Limnocylindria bacterium]